MEECIKGLNGDLTLWRADIASIVAEHDRDMKSEVAELGRERNQLERDLKVQFSKLGEDTKLGIEQLKTSQTHVEGNLHQFGIQLGVNKRELSSELDVKVLQVGEKMLTRENTFLVRVCLAVSDPTRSPFKTLRLIHMKLATTLVVGSLGTLATVWKK